MKLGKYFPFLLVFSVISAAIEIDLALPSFPDMARAFSVSEEVIEGTISLNFLGFCISALFYGPLSDRYGRRPTLLFGTVLFLIGSLCCSFASTIDVILIARFIQGLGAAGSFVLVFTMLSDVFEGNEVTRWMGFLNAILTATMAFAPILGGYLNIYFGWNASYTFISLLTSIQLVLLYLFLPETRKGQVVLVKEVIQDYARFLYSFRFLQGALIPTVLAGGYMAFVTIIPFLYRDKLGMSLREFSYHQAALIASFSVISFFTNRLTNRFGDKKTALAGSLLSVMATMTLLVCSSSENIPSIWIISPLMCLYSASCAIPFTVLFGATLSIFPKKNGAASSFLMSLRTLSCALIIQFAGTMYDGTLFSTAAIVACSCLISLFFVIGFYFRKNTVDVIYN